MTLVLWCYFLNLRVNKVYVYKCIHMYVHQLCFLFIRTAREGQHYWTCLNHRGVEVPLRLSPFNVANQKLITNFF